MDSDAQKRKAAEKALDYIGDGMRLGLGTGSTAAHFVDLVGARVRDGLKLRCVPTSEATRRQAEGLGIPLATLDELPELDLTVDGADELDVDLRLIKGGGGALLREKIVAAASRRMVVIADASKQVETLGAFPLPVEVDRFGWRSTLARVTEAAGAAGARGRILRREKGGEPFVTDGGNYILDCAFGQIADAGKLADALSRAIGVVEHGLFIGLASAAVIAGPAGVRILGMKPAEI
ncbi:MAG: ribose-5-phosphate isomerase RpiA [Pseudomonadota bacterium]|nr:ribose-5-phosphate isomerase RpiA [Pseudomonadota bacterium]